MPTQTITIPRTQKFIPPHLRGDKDFWGSAQIRVKCEAFVQNDDELWIRMFMRADEAKGDQTLAQGETTFLAWRDPNVSKIDAIVSKATTEFEYRDTDHAEDRIELDTAELVRAFIVTGDTWGDEAGSRTGFSAEFNPIQLEVTRTGGNPVLTVTPKVVDITPPHVSGDRDFWGNGPFVSLTANISVENKTNIETLSRFYHHFCFQVFI